MRSSNALILTRPFFGSESGQPEIDRALAASPSMRGTLRFFEKVGGRDCLDVAFQRMLMMPASIALLFVTPGYPLRLIVILLAAYFVGRNWLAVLLLDETSRSLETDPDRAEAVDRERRRATFVAVCSVAWWAAVLT